MYRNNASAVENLVRAVEDANAVCVSERSYDGQTPLYTATYLARSSIVNILMDAGADPSAANEDGDTALCYAVYASKSEIAERLANGGADVDAVCVSERSYGGQTPLYRAAYVGDDSIVNLLLDAGADPNAANADGDTAICNAVYARKPEIVEGLVNGGANVHAVCVSERPYGGQTPLYTASRFRDDSIAQILLNTGAVQDTTGSSETSPADGRGIAFLEGESTTRSVPENTPPGINVGAPVSAQGDGTLTYTIGGMDASSFTIVPSTGQVRTKDGVVYDYETKNRYAVTVGADDENGESDTIDVTIHLEDMVPACQPVRNLRTNHGDGYVTVKWTPALQQDGKAGMLGYQVEMRHGDNGPWTGRRTVLGRSIAATIYGDLENLETHWFRIRPINTESDCGWSPPTSGIPAEIPTPAYPIDRFGTAPVGTPDRNWRFVTQERCRYTADGIRLDANCQFENTGPDTSRITLEFDDPSRGSCDIVLAFSSLTAGAFADDCFDAGVNTETPFDTSFRMPRIGTQAPSARRQRVALLLPAAECLTIYQ